MTPQEIKDQIFKSYIGLRVGLAYIAFAFPIGLALIGVIYGISFQNSMSAYYYAQIPGDSVKYIFPMRAWFVGILWAIGAFLYLYKGFSATENLYLNTAGLAAIGVAMLPMKVPAGCDCGPNELAWLHLPAAGLLFLCISLVAWACRDETLGKLPAEFREIWRRRYTRLALAITFVPAVVYLVIWFLWEDEQNQGLFKKDHPGMFWAELFGVTIFAVYWLRKSQELDTLGLEIKQSGTGFTAAAPEAHDTAAAAPEAHDTAAAAPEAHDTAAAAGCRRGNELPGKLSATVEAARQRLGNWYDEKKSDKLPTKIPQPPTNAKEALEVCERLEGYGFTVVPHESRVEWMNLKTFLRVAAGEKEDPVPPVAARPR